jgi:hypothetical protein
MRIRFVSVALVALSPLGSSALIAARAAADILPPQRRDTAVAAADRITERTSPARVAEDLPNPFNPPGFDQPVPGSSVANPAAPRPGGGTAPAPGPVAPAAPVQPTGDREVLETLAMRLTPSGMIALGGKPLLIIDRNRFEVGTKFIVTFNDQDYELELAAIDRTTFTLRYRGEEITRPIKPVK